MSIKQTLIDRIKTIDPGFTLTENAPEGTSGVWLEGPWPSMIFAVDFEDENNNGYLVSVNADPILVARVVQGISDLGLKLRGAYCEVIGEEGLTGEIVHGQEAYKLKIQHDILRAQAHVAAERKNQAKVVAPPEKKIILAR